MEKQYDSEINWEEFKFTDEALKKQFGLIKKQMKQQKELIGQQNTANQQLLQFNQMQKQQLEDLQKVNDEQKVKIEEQSQSIKDKEKIIMELERQLKKNMGKVGQTANSAIDMQQSMEIVSLPYGQDVFPILKYSNEKEYDHKFWKMSFLKLTKDKYFKRYEFSKNHMYESYTKKCKYILIERVYENNKTLFTKLKKQDDLSFAELMQFNSSQTLEYIQGEESERVFLDNINKGYQWFNYNYIWYLNQQYRLGIKITFKNKNDMSNIMENYLMNVDFGIGKQGKRQDRILTLNVYGLNS